MDGTDQIDFIKEMIHPLSTIVKDNHQLMQSLSTQDNHQLKDLSNTTIQDNNKS